MFYLKMGVGVVMCAVGGWQLAGVLNEGNETSGGSGSMFSISSEHYEWSARCNKVAKSAFGSGPVGPVKMNGAMLKLREQGCNPSKAPAGVIPPLAEPGSRTKSEKQPNDWGGQGGATRNAADDWGN